MFLTAHIYSDAINFLQDLNQQLTSKVDSLNELVRTTLEKVDAAERKVNESAKKSHTRKNLSTDQVPLVPGLNIDSDELK